jgi:hypothetical protein
VALIATMWWFGCTALEAAAKLECGFNPTQAIEKYWAEQEKKNGK